MTAASAERDLELALDEQARRTESYRRSLGTTGEMSAYASLVAASRRVSACDRALRRARSGLGGFALRVPADATAPGRARREVAHRLDGQVDVSVAKTVELLVSETVTNAVTHGTGPDHETVSLEGGVLADRVRLEVTNSGPDFDHVSALPPVTKPKGRGLFLVERLSCAWGFGHVAGMTGVWFEVAA